MEIGASFLFFLVVSSLISCVKTRESRTSPLGCLIKKIKCNPDEYCCRVPFPGICKKYTHEFNEDDVPHITYEDFLTDHNNDFENGNSNENSRERNTDYDMMYFNTPDISGNEGFVRTDIKRQQQPNYKRTNILNQKRRYVGPETFEKFDYLRDEDEWPPMEIPLTQAKYVRDEESYANGKNSDKESPENKMNRDEESHENEKNRDEESHENEKNRDEESHENEKNRDEESRENEMNRDEESHENEKNRDEESYANGKNRDKESHENEKNRYEESRENEKNRDEESRENEMNRDEESHEKYRDEEESYGNAGRMDGFGRQGSHRDDAFKRQNGDNGDNDGDGISQIRNKKRRNNDADFDFDIRPLEYSDEEKVKHSSIPHKPSTVKEEKIEHIRTNVLENKASKKAKVSTLISGKLDKEKEDIVVQRNPDQTYAKVKDFFKSQQVSSIVDVPIAEKKREGIKFQSFQTDNVKRSMIPATPLYPQQIQLHVQKRINSDQADDLLNALQHHLWGLNTKKRAFKTAHISDDEVSLHMINDDSTTKGQKPSNVVERINRDNSLKSALHHASGVKVVSASIKNKKVKEHKDSSFMITTLVIAGCVTGVLLASICIFIIIKRNENNRQLVLKPSGQEAASDYQSLWRQLRQVTWDAPVQTTPISTSVEHKPYFGNKSLATKYSWGEEPVDTKMDISTGHVVLAYMEDHLKNEDRLSKEWDELSVYEAEPNETNIGQDAKNSKKNRYSDVLPYDHNRVKLRETSNATGSDYINASYIIDDDPNNAAYIATQGPLGSTVADFWQMIWEQGVAVIVMITKLAELGLPQCHRYWPEKGNETYHIYQVHLISEHIWCSDYLVRSFFLKNIQTGETRTVTQFHFLSWPHLGIPASSKPLLDFRRKVQKSFRSLSSPVVVHCSGGIDRTGTYILIDMVLGKMSKGTKEIDIAATLEYLRDQRPGMVKTKAQFEFALTSVAEEVNAILLALTKH